MDIFFTNILKIFQNFFYYSLIFFLLHINESQAFVGGSSMGSGGGASSGTPSIKSGISIVDPEGKSFNCEPFVDKKWESTSNEDSWNGVYFSIGAEASKISGAFKIENSINMSPSSRGYSSSRTIGTFPDLNSSKSFKGSSSIPVLNVGGGFLIDRVYLASDFEIRMSPFEFDQKIKILETTYTPAKNNLSETSVTKDSESTFTFTFNNYLMFNSKIGYLLTDRSMVYFNAGIGSFNFSNIKFKGDYSVPESEIGDISPPIRLSLGTEFLLSNHFRLIADYSHWIVPQIMGSFYLENQKNPTKGFRSTNSYVADFKINSLKLGILYRF